MLIVKKKAKKQAHRQAEKTVVMKEVDIAVQRDYKQSREEATPTIILQMLTTATEVTFASKAVKQFCMLHAGEAMKMTTRHMKISMKNILVCYAQEQSTG